MEPALPASRQHRGKRIGNPKNILIFEHGCAGMKERAKRRPNLFRTSFESLSKPDASMLQIDMSLPDHSPRFSPKAKENFCRRHA